MIEPEVLPGEGSDSRIETIAHDGVRWTMVERPGRDEIAQLKARYGFHQLDLDDLVSKTERPKVDSRDGNVFMVLHFPVLLARPRRLAVGELHVIIGPDYLVTVHDGDLRPPVRLFQELRDDPSRRAELLGSPGRALYEVIMAMIDASRPWIDRLSTAVQSLQEDVFARLDPEGVRRLVEMRFEVIRLHRMIHPDLAAVDSLRQRWTAAPELTLYWDNVHDQLGWLDDYLEDVEQMLEALSHSCDQLATQRTTSVMRLLTAISTILLPLAVLSGIYGMNIKGLPFAEAEYAFELTIGMMLAVAVGLLVLFRRRGWV